MPAAACRLVQPRWRDSPVDFHLGVEGNAGQQRSEAMGVDSLRVAIVGAGPAGFYAADRLIKLGGCQVDLFERLPAPFGLLRYGVAPDHQNIKRAGAAFERTAALAGCRYFGNVQVGRDITVDELLSDYDQLLIATGSGGDRKLGLPGEDLLGSIAATSFVGWYNGHPDFSALTFDLESSRAVIVGMGNVALDVARVLVRDPGELATTDIASYALEALQRSRVREVVLVGRRGPAQAAFDHGELEDIAALAGVEVVVEGAVELQVTPGLSTPAKRNVELMATLPRRATSNAERRVRLRFLAAPRRLVGLGPRVGGIELERMELVTRPDGSVSARGVGETETLTTGLVIRSIGYQASPLPGLPFDENASLIPNSGGRVVSADAALERSYVVGWIKRGPVGLLGTNKQDAAETVDSMLGDRERALATRAERQPGRVARLLQERGVRTISYAEWLRLDALERELGVSRGKVREKLYSVQSMLQALDSR